MEPRVPMLDHQSINSIAAGLVALATQAGALQRGYQREWSWVDKQNYVDDVDADEFNEAFHGIEREFDKLRDVLAQGTGDLPVPWVSDETTLTQDMPWVSLQHNLNSRRLLVNVEVAVPQAEKQRLANLPALAGRGLDPSQQWWAGSLQKDLNPNAARYMLPDPNQILLGSNFAPVINGGGFELTVRARIWKY